MPHLPEFRPDVDMVKVKFQKGLVFQSGSQFKDVVREYAIQNGKDIFFKKNEPTRVRAKCGGVNCPWELYASKIDDTPTFVVKTFNETHQCPRINANRFATGKWLGKKYLDEFKMHDKWGISSFQLKVGKIQPGRPKKNRRLELDEIAPPEAKRLRRRFHKMRCSGCGLQGHNFRTCSKNNKNKANEAPADPGEYSRNVNPEINQSVSSANRDSSLQPATTQAESCNSPLTSVLDGRDHQLHALHLTWESNSILSFNALPKRCGSARLDVVKISCRLRWDMLTSIDAPTRKEEYKSSTRNNIWRLSILMNNMSCHVNPSNRVLPDDTRPTRWDRNTTNSSKKAITQFDFLHSVVCAPAHYL
ncbi:hypothetical protein G4B88_002792 [Cannabis sativa]|uniref:Transposase MuDR plant domain-containing protein n=1 Tax=Cannabis sativa TaxID=3483 RepID=A0A7J6HIP9_CANSA|nr:hypothetical protein G4B88_002792 [Cannabis sativa]